MSSMGCRQPTASAVGHAARAFRRCWWAQMGHRSGCAHAEVLNSPCCHPAPVEIRSTYRSLHIVPYEVFRYVYITPYFQLSQRFRNGCRLILRAGEPSHVRASERSPSTRTHSAGSGSGRGVSAPNGSGGPSRLTGPLGPNTIHPCPAPVAAAGGSGRGVSAPNGSGRPKPAHRAPGAESSSFDLRATCFTLLSGRHLRRVV